MKRIILLVFATCWCTIASAQLLKLNEDAVLDSKVLEVQLDGPAMAALELQNELNLTKAQYEQVVLLNQMRYKQILAAEEAYREDALLRSKTIYAIHMETDKALGALLDPKQKRLYLELEGLQQMRFVSDNSEK